MRDKTGDYVSDMLSENSGVDGEPMLLADQPDARCSRDLCLAERLAGGRKWRSLATRSVYLVPVEELIAACRTADIVVSERRLPNACTPRWLRLDQTTLARTGGVAITLATGHVATVQRAGDRHPWRVPPVALNRNGAADRRAYPARAPDRGRNAGGHRRDWRDRAAPSRPRDGNI